MYSPKCMQEICINGSKAAADVMMFAMVFGAEEGKLYMSQAEIAELMGNSLRTTQTGVSELIKINALQKSGGITYINPKLACSGDRAKAERDWKKLYDTCTIDYRYSEV